jgi:hypothetical protein
MDRGIDRRLACFAEMGVFCCVIKVSFEGDGDARSTVGDMPTAYDQVVQLSREC